VSLHIIVDVIPFYLKPAIFRKSLLPDFTKLKIFTPLPVKDVPFVRQSEFLSLLLTGF